MQIFRCACGATLFFENDRCLRCNRDLGYLPDRRTLSALEAGNGNAFRALAADGALYRKCSNYEKENVCNWMIPIADEAPFCLACRLNDTIPNLSSAKNREYWARIETAKRRLVYSIMRLGLPLENRQEDPQNGLAFAFLESPPKTGNENEATDRVMTGHANGLITINVAEADEIEREQMRRMMHESYRTLLGHFRHESGHYFWDRLVRDSRWIEPFRALFGDERADYAKALEQHYATGGPPAWQDRYISVYASSHPWEDWAETWAHYLHMVDTIETSRALGVVPDGAADEMIDQRLFGLAEYKRRKSDGYAAEVAMLLRDWVWLTIAMNSINRSMGMRDAYPFILNASVAKKLQLVHEVVMASQPNPRAVAR